VPLPADALAVGAETGSFADSVRLALLLVVAAATRRFTGHNGSAKMAACSSGRSLGRMGEDQFAPRAPRRAALCMKRPTMALDRAAPKTRQVAAAVIGNALEWYDFIIFGYLTVVIARLFFPAGSQYASLLLTTATFGVGFFMRPVGGILLGIYADRHGRKAALQLIIGVMTLAIAMIAFAPAYSVIGVAAPVIIVAVRLLQGFPTGGEFASATAFLVESALPHRRGSYGS
jgi:hypothetical protein